MTSVAVLRDLKSEHSVSMERYADQLARIIQSSDSMALVDAPTPEKGVHQISGPIDKLLRYRRRYIDYPRALRGVDADVYHIADHAYAFLLRALPRCRTVVTCHDLMLFTQEEWRDKPRWTPAVSLLKYSVSHLREAAVVITVSENTRQDILRFKLASEQRIVVIPPPIARVFRASNVGYPDEAKEPTQLQQNDFTILHVGSPGRYKNLPRVLEVVAELRRRNVPAVLVRVGRDLRGAEAQLVRDLGIERWVRELGFLPDEELAKIYRTSDALLFPSFKEGFGWPVVEAMASGLPVVASRDRAISASLAGAGLQVDAADTRGLSDALEALWQDPSMRHDLANKGLRRAERFSFEAVGAEIRNVYREVADLADSR